MTLKHASALIVGRGLGAAIDRSYESGSGNSPTLISSANFRNGLYAMQQTNNDASLNGMLLERLATLDAVDDEIRVWVEWRPVSCSQTTGTIAVIRLVAVGGAAGDEIHIYFDRDKSNIGLKTGSDSVQWASPAVSWDFNNTYEFELRLKMTIASPTFDYEVELRRDGASIISKTWTSRSSNFDPNALWVNALHTKPNSGEVHFGDMIAEGDVAADNAWPTEYGSDGPHWDFVLADADEPTYSDWLDSGGDATADGVKYQEIDDPQGDSDQDTSFIETYGNPRLRQDVGLGSFGVVSGSDTIIAVGLQGIFRLVSGSTPLLGQAIGLLSGGLHTAHSLQSPGNYVYGRYSWWDTQPDASAWDLTAANDIYGQLDRPGLGTSQYRCTALAGVLIYSTPAGAGTPFGQIASDTLVAASFSPTDRRFGSVPSTETVNPASGARRWGAVPSDELVPDPWT